MRSTTVREANQNFSRLLAEVEQGETILIKKNGRVVAELRPRAEDPADDPAWRARRDAMLALMRDWPDRGYTVGEITEADKYGDA